MLSRKKIPIILIKDIAINVIIGILKISGNKNTVTKGIRMKVNYFKRLAKKEGSGQKAIKKLVRDDDSERSLKDLQRIYGKPTNIKPKPKPKAVVGTANVSDFVK